jgi:hypothetical protein
LHKFGYLPNVSNVTDNNLNTAIRELQRIGNVYPSGQLDNQTLDLLERKRCGLADTEIVRMTHGFVFAGFQMNVVISVTGRCFLQNETDGFRTSKCCSSSVLIFLCFLSLKYTGSCFCAFRGQRLQKEFNDVMSPHPLCSTVACDRRGAVACRSGFSGLLPLKNYYSAVFQDKNSTDFILCV